MAIVIVAMLAGVDERRRRRGDPDRALRSAESGRLRQRGGRRRAGRSCSALRGAGSSSGRPSTADPVTRAPARSGRAATTCSRHPDTYAELGGLTWQTATAMGGLAYMTPLRITWGAHSAIAYKRDFGLGGGPIAGCRASSTCGGSSPSGSGSRTRAACGPVPSGSPARLSPAPRACSGRPPRRRPRPAARCWRPPRRRPTQRRARPGSPAGVPLTPGRAGTAAAGRSGGRAPERSGRRSRR